MAAQSTTRLIEIRLFIIEELSYSRILMSWHDFAIKNKLELTEIEDFPNEGPR